jgi:hypothetical protein
MNHAPHYREGVRDDQVLFIEVLLA